MFEFVTRVRQYRVEFSRREFVNFVRASSWGDVQIGSWMWSRVIYKVWWQTLCRDSYTWVRWAFLDGLLNISWFILLMLSSSSKMSSLIFRMIHQPKLSTKQIVNSFSWIKRLSRIILIWANMHKTCYYHSPLHIL